MTKFVPLFWAIYPDTSIKNIRYIESGSTEDGQGNSCDENGCDAMECEEEINPFHLKTLTRLRLYCEKQNTEQKDTEMEALDAEMEEIATNVKINRSRSYNNYTNDQKLLFVYYNRIKLFNAANSAGQLDEKHKIHLLNFYGSNPQARVVDAVCSLTEKFESFTLKESSVRSFLKTECNLSFKKKKNHSSSSSQKRFHQSCKPHSVGLRSGAKQIWITLKTVFLLMNQPSISI
ncbi:uncharacterized protein BX663DRAFT_484778 [Cokeromyces recurvatus]|uniref:uncharacterized protein n=1 Tax=Cokeromyces recurvatus TaxID=90255 RepID=UPI00221E67C5|nr:uncharacterized protein BX663DRAFT_484778 [Cokeromyces recurvatus]KAI7904674.1 hypothetical protein BX663DRAFT_484778 [Cokeromyces recurvatus]